MAIAGVLFGFRFSSVQWRASSVAVQFGMRVASAQAYAGPGFLAGQGPSSSDPTEPDGRFRILNQPARGRIQVYDRGTANCIASVLSNPDGTWRVDRLDPNLFVTVIGYDDSGQQNAAIQDWVRPAVAE